MTGIIDTSSLIAIARYYLSIKEECDILQFLESKFRNGELLLLKTVYNEAKKTQKGISTTLMSFLNDETLHIKDEDLLPPSPQKFSNLIDNNFCIPVMRKTLNEDQFQQHKLEYMKTADMKMILYVLNNKNLNPIIITEETHVSNDKKLFRKIPAICDQLGIKHTQITKWLVDNGISLNWIFNQVY